MSVTYRWEIKQARDRLADLLSRATRPGWERTEDVHRTNGPTEYGLWSVGRGEYVAEHIHNGGDANYLEVADTGFGRQVLMILTSVLESDEDDLDVTGIHEECQGDGSCVLGATIHLARYVNKSRRP